MADLPWSSKGSKATPVNADQVMMIDSADPTPATTNKRATLVSMPFINQDGTKALTSDWDVGPNRIITQDLTVTTDLQIQTYTVTLGGDITTAGEINTAADLTVESASTLDQDYTTDASPEWVGATFSGLATADGIVQTNGSGDISSSKTIADGVSTGQFTVADSPTNGTDAANKDYVDHHSVAHGNGFVVGTDSTFSYNPLLDPVTIQLAPTGSDFKYYLDRLQYTVTSGSPWNDTHAATTGVYYWYVNSSNVLTMATSGPDLTTEMYISQMVYDSAPGDITPAGFVIDKRYRSDDNVADPKNVIVDSGFDMNNFTVQPVSPVNSDNQFGIDAGVVKDSDILTNVPLLLATVGPYYNFYRGASNDWKIDISRTIPFGVSVSIITYNQNLGGGNWQQTQVPDTRYVNYYVFAIPVVFGSPYRFLFVPGQTTYQTIGEATAENFSDLDITGAFLPTYAPLYRIVWSRNVGWTTIGQTRIERIDNLRTLTQEQLENPNHYVTRPLTSAPELELIQDQGVSLSGGLTVEATSIINQDLSSDSTAAQFATLTLTNAPSSDTDAVNKSYADALSQSLHWQAAVKDEVDFTTAEPGAPSTGDRYINTVTGTSSGTAQSVTATYIYEWNGSTWTETVPTEGYALWVEDLDLNKVFNGSAWVPFGNTVTHNNLASLQGGTSGEYFHLTSAEYSALGSIWSRVGITISPVTAGDYLNMGTGRFIAGNITIDGSTDTISTASGGLDINAATNQDIVLSVDSASSEIKFVRETSATNTIEEVIKVRHTTSGSPAVGIGAGLDLEAEIRTNTYRAGAELQASFSNVGAGTEESDFILNTYQGGSLTESLRFDGSAISFDVTGDLSTTGDIAVNGGNITSTGALDINPTGNFSMTMAGSENWTVNMGTGVPLFESSSEFNFTLRTNVSSAGEIDLEIQKSRAGGIITTGDRLGRINFEGHDGSSYREGALIQVTSEGTIAAGQIPASMQFWTAQTDGSITEKLRLETNGITVKFDTTLSEGIDFVLGTTTGSKIGTATSQKLAFYNSTPVIQPSATGETVGFTAGAGTGVNDDSTFTGNVGATAYRLSDIVKHLKNLGLIAA